LKAEVSGAVICSLNSFLPQLKNLKASEQRLEEDLELWAVSKSHLVEYNALWKVIAENRPTWDIVDEIEESPFLMRELVELQLKVSELIMLQIFSFQICVQLADQLLLRYRMINIRTEQMKKIIPHLGAPWPKIAEIEAIGELTELIKFQTSCLKHAIK